MQFDIEVASSKIKINPIPNDKTPREIIIALIILYFPTDSIFKIQNITPRLTGARRAIARPGTGAGYVRIIFSSCSA